MAGKEEYRMVKAETLIDGFENYLVDGMKLRTYGWQFIFLFDDSQLCRYLLFYLLSPTTLTIDDVFVRIIAYSPDKRQACINGLDKEKVLLLDMSLVQPVEEGSIVMILGEFCCPSPNVDFRGVRVTTIRQVNTFNLPNYYKALDQQSAFFAQRGLTQLAWN